MRPASPPVSSGRPSFWARMLRLGGLGLLGVILVTCGEPTAVNNGPGPATKIVFTTQPTNATAGQTMSTVSVTVIDDKGNTSVGFNSAVTLSITAGTGTAGATLGGTVTATAAQGVATFSALQITKSGTAYRLSAAATGLTLVSPSSTFDIAAGPAAKLVFTTQPVTSTAGATLASIVVTAQDAFGNTATSFTNTVAIGFGTNPGGGTLTGSVSLAAAGGVATFSTLKINKVGTGYTLKATSLGLTEDVSASFNINPGAAASLAFTVQPVDATAGQAIAPAVEVTALDAQGNVATGFAGSVTLGITTGTSGATLTGATATATTGKATFAGLSIDKSGAGYTLTATATSLTSVPSTAFTISAGAASQLAFTVQPGNATAGTVIPGATGPTVQVSAQDGLGNLVTTFTGQVTVTIGTNGGGGTLTGTTIVPQATAGVATFSNLLIDKSGAGYTLKATATGLTGTSAAFNIRPAAATLLVFTTQPGAGTSGAVIPGATGATVQVTARDAFGNTDTTFKTFVTVALSGGPATATLTGTATVLAAAGIATFGDLKVDSAGSYTLAASTTATGVTGVSSSAFVIGPSAASQLTFSAQPVTTTAGQSIPTIAVTVRDAAGNVVPSFVGNVTLSLGANPTGGTIGGGSLQQPVSSGVATFSGLNIIKAGVGYKLLAASAPLPSVLSSAFNISAGTASKLAFTVEPASPATAGAAITPGTGVQVAGQDQFGNIDPTFTGSVVVAIGTNGGGGTLTGTKTVAAVAGTATFTTLNIDKAGPGYTLTAALTGLQGATSASFNVKAAPATQLAFTVQPAAATAGAAIPGTAGSVKVTALDQFLNIDSAFAGSVTLAINSGPAGAAISNATATVGAGTGVATFATVSVDKVGAYTLSATSGTLTLVAPSSGFNVTAALATKLVFTIEPATATAGTAIPGATGTITVTAQDQFNNTATGFTGDVSVAIANNAGNPAGTLTGTTDVAAATAGVATFGSLNIDKTGAGYTLSATTTATGVTAATSAGFSITPAAANHLAFTTQPVSAQAAAGIGPVGVTALDQFNNIDTNFTANVTLGLTGGTGGAVLSGGGPTAPGTKTGVTTFNSPSVNLTGTAYQLTASANPAGGPISATLNSSQFDITAGTAIKLAFLVGPGNATAGAAIPGNPGTITVAAQDAQGNTVPGFGSNISLSIGTNPGTGTVTGTATVQASSGLATFSDARINESGNGYQLLASSGALTTALSGSFNITPAGISASQSTVSASPSPITAGGAASTVTVTVRDAFGNPISGATVSLGSSGTNNTITGPVGSTNASGVATGTLASTKAEQKTVTATVNPGASQVVISQTASVTVDPAAVSASQSTVGASPASITASTGATQATITVTAKDQFGNLIPNAAVVLSATGTGNTIVPPGLTNAAGVATGALSSTDASASPKVVSATVDAGAGAVAITQTANVTVNPGGASASLSTITATGPITASNGASQSTIVVTARDALGNTIPSAAVILQVSGTANTINIPASTNASGVASGTLSSTKAEVKNLQVSIGGATINQTASVTVNPDVISASISTAAASSPIIASNGSSASDITVTVNDQFANPIQGATVQLASTGTGNTVTQPASTTNPSGVATGTISSTKAETKQVTATVNPGGSQVVITQKPNVVVGNAPVSASLSTVVASTPITASNGTSASTITVTAKDPFSNLIQGSTVVLASDGMGNTVTNPASTTNSSGVATGTLSSTKAEAKTVSATIDGIAIVQTAPVTVGPAGVSSSHSTLTATPSPITASNGSSASTVTVTAKDQFDNLIQGATVALSSNGSNNSFTVPALTDASGVTTSSFSSTKAEVKDVSGTINAGAGAVGVTQHASVTVDPAAANKLLYSVGPTGAIEGTKISPAVKVIAQDQFSNTITTFNKGVAITSSGGTLSGGGPLGPDGTGTVTFSNLSIVTPGSYTLTASASGVPNSAVANGVNISASTANKLVFTIQPGSATAGQNNPATVQVAALDAAGNLATDLDGSSVDLVITAGTGTAGANLINGPISATLGGGMATFTTADLQIDSAGTAYQVTASVGAASTTSAPFNIIAGAASQLVFTVQPSAAASLAAIAPAIQVRALDAIGNVATTGSGTVTLAFGPSSIGGAGVLSGTSATMSGGLATFAATSIDVAAAGYTLEASGTSGTINTFTSPESQFFDITPTPPSGLFFTSPALVQVVAGTPQSVQVTAKAGASTLTGFSGNVTLTIVGGGKFSNGKDTLTAAATLGVANFSAAINRVGTYTLAATTASVTSLAGATSNSFSVTADVAARIAFTTQPGDKDVTQTNSVQLAAWDQYGNPASSVPVTVDIAPGTGAPGAAIVGGPVSGSTGFSIAGIGITRSGTNYTLKATSGALTATSSSFNIIAGSATHLVYTVQPVDGLALNTNIHVEVTALDAYDNVATGFNGTVAFALGNNPGNSALLLNAPNPATAIAGLATFDFALVNTGVGYTLVASSSGVTGVVSVPFTMQ
jgi:hypothetical protein